MLRYNLFEILRAKIFDMSEIKNVLICGLGAIGTIYAEKIQRTKSAELKVLVDESRLERYKSNPVVFNGKSLYFDYILQTNTDFKADLIIIATKFSGLEAVIQNIENFVDEDTIILSLLNGVTSEKLISSKYGKEKVLHSYFIGHSAVRDGRNIIHDGINTLVFGAVEPNEKVDIIKDFFEKSGVNYEISDNILRSMWLKFMLNVSANQTTAVLGYTFKELMDSEKAMELAKKLMTEVQLIAKAEGISNTDMMIEETIESFKKMLPEGKTSMLQDVEAGRKTEVDLFAGTVSSLGKKYKIPTPYNDVIKDIIEAMS